MLSRRFALLSVAVGLATAALPAIAAESPRDIVVAIYKVAAGSDGQYSGANAYDDKTIRKRYFSKAFLKAAAANEKGGETGLDWDPITNSQDPSVSKLDIRPETETPTTATIAAHFLQGGTQPDVVRYDFIKEGSAWKLDDIRCGDGEGAISVRKTLAKPD